jgi:hypothetical protein
MAEGSYEQTATMRLFPRKVMRSRTAPKTGDEPAYLGRIDAVGYRNALREPRVRARLDRARAAAKLRRIG